MMRLIAVVTLFFLIGLPASGRISDLHSLTRLRDEITRRESSSDPDWRNGNRDARAIEPGETLVLADLQGPGEITHIWCTVAAGEPQYSRLLVLRMYWDGEEHPSVECPLGDFFGLGHGWDVPFDSLPVRVTANGGTEAESLVDRVTVTAGKVQRQELTLFSGGAQLFWTPENEGQALSIPIEIKQYGRRVLFLVTTYSFDFGTFSVELNGKPLGITFDLYARNPFLHEQVMELGFLEPGTYTLTLRNTGKNEASKGYFLGIDALFVRRMAR